MRRGQVDEMASADRSRNLACRNRHRVWSRRLGGKAAPSFASRVAVPSNGFKVDNYCEHSYPTMPHQPLATFSFTRWADVSKVVHHVVVMKKAIIGSQNVGDERSAAITPANYSRFTAPFFAVLKRLDPVLLKIRERIKRMDWINLLQESLTSPAGARANPSRLNEAGRVVRADSRFHALSRLTTLSEAIAPEFETAGFPVAAAACCKQLRARMLKYEPAFLLWMKALLLNPADNLDACIAGMGDAFAVVAKKAENELVQACAAPAAAMAQVVDRGITTKGGGNQYLERKAKTAAAVLTRTVIEYWESEAACPLVKEEAMNAQNIRKCTCVTRNGRSPPITRISGAWTTKADVSRSRSGLASRRKADPTGRALVCHGARLR
jgi:hypothetical protein